MVKQYLSRRNPNKRIIAKVSNDKSIIEIVTGINDATGIARCAYIIAQVDGDGNAVAPDGIMLGADEVVALAEALARLVKDGKIRTSAPFAEVKPVAQAPQKQLLW